VHLPKAVALKLLSKAFEQSKTSSTFVMISGTVATKCGKSLYPFNFCFLLNFVFFFFLIFFLFHIYFSGFSLFLLFCANLFSCLFLNLIRFGFVPFENLAFYFCERAHIFHTHAISFC
jgi:hypothetical protein